MVDVSLSLFAGAGWQFFDNSGNILSGGRLYSYEAGSSTPAQTYADSTGNVSNGVYVQLDSAGRPASEVWLESTQNYKFEVKSSTGQLIRTYDDIYGAASASGLAALIADLLSTAGSTLIGWIRSAAGAVAKTVSVKLGYRIDAEDFMPNSWNPAVDVVTTQMQAAIDNAALTGRILYWPPKFISGALTVPGNVHLRGVGEGSVLTAVAGSYVGFTINASFVKIQDLRIEAGAKSGGVDFALACGTTTMRRVTLQDIISYDSRGFISDSGTGTGYHIGTRLMNCQTTRLNGPGVAFTRLYAYGFLREVSMDFVGVPTGNYTGFSFDGSTLGTPDAGGVELVACNVLGSASAYTTNVANQRGYQFTDIANVQLNRVTADGVGDWAFYFDGVNVVEGVDVKASISCKGHYFKDVTNSTFASSYASGRNYLVYAPPTQDGFFFDTGNANLNFTGVFARDWTGNCINKSAAQAGAINVTGLTGQASTLRGIKSTGNSAFFVVGGSLGGNVAGNYDIGGNSDYLWSIQLNSGGVVDIGPGPASG